MLAPKEEIVAVAAVFRSDGKRLSPALYRMAATLEATGEVAKIAEFEVREVTTEEDKLNSLFHRATRAEWNKRYEDAEKALREILKVRPENLRANAAMASLEGSRRNYAVAIEWLRKTIELAESGVDRSTPMGKLTIEDWVATLKAQIQAWSRLTGDKR